MIKAGEIDKIAIRQGVRATQIQKDYVIFGFFGEYPEMNS